MEANPKKLLDEFIPEAMGKQFVIPVYQRKYTWTVKKQLVQFISDLVELINDQNLDKQHFLGTIVYLEKIIDYKTERLIVDGQQRLVTMFLIAHAMKAIADTEFKKYEIESTYLFNKAESPESRYYQRLFPAVADGNDYRAISQGKFEEVKQNKSNIVKNFVYLTNELKKLVDEYSFERVLFGLKRFSIVYIKLDDRDDAQQIFESINSTGERLTASDLIRNFVMMNKSNKEQTRIYDNYWRKLEGIFDNSKSMEDFFRSYLAAIDGKYSEKSYLYQAFKNYWAKEMKVSPENNILEKLVRYATYYQHLYFEKPVGQYAMILDDFQQMGGTILSPIVMEFSEWFKEEHKISEKQFYNTLKILNTYQIRRTFNGDEVGKVSKAFPTYLKPIKKYAETYGYQYFEDILKFCLITRNQSRNMALPTDKSLRANMEIQNAYAMRQTRWLLAKIENHENYAPVDLNSLSIEHIMPQTINDYWKKKAGVDGEDYTDLVNTLGNLTLVSKVDNSKAGNKNFQTKKKIFEDTLHIQMNKDLYRMEEWNNKTISERGNRMVSDLIEMYPYLYSEGDYEQEKDHKVYLDINGVKAEGSLSKNETLTIFAGSQINPKASEVSSDKLDNLRKKLIDDGIIADSGSGMYFVHDYVPSSVSNGAELVLGGSRNGWQCWKDSAGMLINDSLRNKSLNQKGNED
ncbi:hypothetical protein LFYK43_05080 [Ligilactobacillus salitolerans]|uniref:DUF4357 domain-containing protein n=1 Tax=Ligilactobacillus salitolerans TaxID=1808352 RepID=A0A401IR80_9LACO|nr:DUF4357 domain-containing protein [Ligilactobacillus salitolerans]GBG94049.1 hypothetical protein LFYK43_05080 [Ligilactobacillus salitolerans]